ncbi:hypothetical protein ACIBG5_20155 [Kribbella sp. NPDC050241]|uniref:hypothetical protein n=1 Tax=Kribbella sp. NPDC050241 TaxID=3364115 RepID=UPI00378F47A9
MITEHQEVARHRVNEQLRAAEVRAERHGRKATRTSGPRYELAGVLRRIADRLDPQRRLDSQRRLAEPQPGHRGTGLSVVR